MTENTSQTANVRVVRPLADGECAAAGCKKLAEKAYAFFDKLKKTCQSRSSFFILGGSQEYKR